MTSSEYVWNTNLDTRSARPHDGSAKAMPGHRWTSIEAARWASSGGLLSTPADYARFLIEIVSPQPGDAFRLNRASLGEMTRPVIQVRDEHRPSSWGGPSSWGLGWQLFDTGGGPVMAHGGDSVGFHSFAAASVVRKSAFVIMTNGEGGRRVVEQLIAPDSMDWLLGT
jgi:CubicO group peptidase (beta-lactamase class C family)